MEIVLWLGLITTRGTVLNGLSIRKVGNHGCGDTFERLRFRVGHFVMYKKPTYTLCFPLSSYTVSHFCPLNQHQGTRVTCASREGGSVEKPVPAVLFLPFIQTAVDDGVVHG